MGSIESARVVARLIYLYEDVAWKSRACHTLRLKCETGNNFYNFYITLDISTKFGECICNGSR